MFVNNNLLLTQHGAIRTDYERCVFDSECSQRDLEMEKNYYTTLQLKVLK